MKTFKHLREEIQLEWNPRLRTRPTKNSHYAGRDYEKESPNITHKVVTDPDTGKQKHVFKGNYSHVEINSDDHKGLEDHINGPIKRVLDRGDAVLSNGHYFAGEHNPEKLHKAFTENLKESDLTKDMASFLQSKGMNAKLRDKTKPNRPAPVGSMGGARGSSNSPVGSKID